MRKKNLCQLSALLLAACGLAVILTGGNRDQFRISDFGFRISAMPTVTSQNKVKVAESYDKLPLHFEVNQGQTNEQVKFLSRGSGYSLFLTANEAVLALRQNPKSQIPKSAVVRMKLVGANAQPQVKGLEELPGRVNYFIGNNPKKWRTNVPTYAKVKYEDVYPGVDVVYYGNQRQLEYDFVVSPGADPKNITLGFEGADKVEVDAQGDLVLRTAGGEVHQRKPLIYQEVDGKRQEIPGGYVLNPQSAIRNPQSVVVGFEVGDYDPTRPLIIDPVLVYSTYLGGSGQDVGRGIAVDSSGNAYVTGFTLSTNFPTANPMQSALGGSNAFVTKLNPTGSTLVYSTYLGGSSEDSATSVAVDSSGNAYVTGSTFSTDFPTVNPLQATKGSPLARDAFVAKLNPTGSALVYSTYLGGSSQDDGTGIVVNASGNAFVTGITSSTNFPTANALQSALGGGEDAFVVKLSTTGNTFVYSTYLGGSGSDEGLGIAVDAAGNACVTGFTNSTNFPTVNPLQPTLGGGTDAFVAKLNPAGSALVYSTYLGGSSFDFGNDIAADTTGNVYVTGETPSTNFPTANPLQPTFGGIFDAFVAKLNPAGSALVYSTYLGGSHADSGYGVAVDTSGNAYVTGRTFSTNFPTANPSQAAKGGGYDAFVTKLNPSGSALVFSTYLGGSNDDIGWGIAADTTGNIYVTGETWSTDFPTVNPLQSAFGGSLRDAFVAKIFAPSNQSPTVNCPPPVTAECTSPAGASVTLTAQVSDPDGDALRVTWTVDNQQVQQDNVPAGGPPTSASVSLTYTYSLGNHTVTVDVEDGRAGDRCSTTVTVQDTTAPSVSCAVALSGLWPPNHNLVNVGLSASVSDACDPNPTVQVLVFGDEDDEEPTGDGVHSPDAKNIGLGTLRLRSERKGNADGRVYLIVVKATDDSGNVGYDCCTVVVPHNLSQAAIDSVNAQAAAAEAFCQTFGTAPPNYYVIGDGPTIGPKQ